MDIAVVLVMLLSIQMILRVVYSVLWKESKEKHQADYTSQKLVFHPKEYRSSRDKLKCK
jgi:hypothetical protein